MNIVEYISHFWLGTIWLKIFDYNKGMDWNFLPYWSIEYILFSLWTIFSSTSGLLIVEDKWFIELLFFASILGVFIDFFILSFISSKNQKFLQKHGEKIPQNKNFIIFFILWRIFLPDIFVASSLAARYFRINLSRKYIFLISLVAQVVRISILAFIYFSL